MSLSKNELTKNSIPVLSENNLIQPYLPCLSQSRASLTRRIVIFANFGFTIFIFRFSLLNLSICNMEQLLFKRLSLIASNRYITDKNDRRIPERPNVLKLGWFYFEALKTNTELLFCFSTFERRKKNTKTNIVAQLSNVKGNTKHICFENNLSF